MSTNITRADAIYDAEYHPLKIKELARVGASLETIGKAFSVSATIVESWLTKYPEAHQAYIDGRKPVDILVEDALLQNALGTEVIEESEMEQDSPMGTISRKIKKVKRTGGDVSAQKFWLANRKPEAWKSTEQAQVGVIVNIPAEDQSF